MDSHEICAATRARLAPQVRFQLDPVTRKSVLLYPEGILELNETAADILACCDGRTFAEIVEALGEQYDVDCRTLLSDVRQALADLRQRKLVELT
jgi:pyrroloquinoline quinone biosynthesis protein D